MGTEVALIVVCPAAEAAVGDQRRQFDRAAQVGVPAHLTVAYPFKTNLTDGDHQKLTELFGSFRAFKLSCERTGWFGDRVVFVEPVDPTPVVMLTEAVQEAFPAYRLHHGAFDEVVAHLTIGHDQPVDVLGAAERVVLDRLPFSQTVTHVELWSGPALATAPAGSWHHERSYLLGDWS